MVNPVPNVPLRGVRDRRVLFALHAVAVVMMAAWVRTLDARLGAVAVLAQLAAAALSFRSAHRWPAAALVVTAALTVVVLATPTPPRGDGDSTATAAARQFAGAIEATQRRLVAAADAVAANPSLLGAAGVGSDDDPLAAVRGTAGVIVYERDSARAWGGRSVIPTSGLWERSGLVVTPLYTVQYAAAVRGDRRVVATNVVSARAPAARLARTLAAAHDVGGTVQFEVRTLPVADSVGVATAVVGGIPILVHASVRDPAAFEAVFTQRTRTRGAALLLVLTLVSLAALLRRAEHLPDRLAATAVPLAAIAITPLNSLSNVTRLFDPATYFVGGGGAFTASVGALAMTSALVLFAVMAAVRGRRRPARRWSAVLVAATVVVLGPYLLRDLARGINLPLGGAGTGLWLAWEVALFLAATSLLAVGATAGHWILGTRRGFPLWVAPVLAVAASLAGPALLRGAASWPVWYPALWASAIGTLVLARRSRAGIFTSAFVAACGATVLLWGATLRERVELATRDVVGMGTVDAGAVALLERFAADLGASTPPGRREELLALYAASDLASADHPVSLARWYAAPSAGAPVLLSLGGDARLSDVGAVVDAARRTAVAQLSILPPNPAMSLALAVPYVTGDVVTVLLGPRTHLTRPPGYAELLGLAGTVGTPPYSVAILGPATDSAAVRAPWRRQGNHLHAEWRLPDGRGAALRVRADVAFDAYETLLPQGMLVVLLNLGIVLVLLVADLAADGVLGRWIRRRRPEWRRSYRVRLSLALFAFFVVPALTFAFWSYRRLQDDDRAARALLVREMLRRAALDTDTAAMSPSVRIAGAGSPVARVVNVPADVPLLVYRNGELVGASDSLMLSVAPVGRWLARDVERLVVEADEPVVTATVGVGASEMLFGFRPLARGIVAAVPARRDEAALDKRRRDLGALVILATVLGALAALWLSGVAARQLARPIRTLRDGALAVAGGSRAPLEVTSAPAEFVPVFRAFDRMARDLSASEARLARAERVFAWGEMARQVAHEIKNPLTPIRLGVQHVLRAWKDGRQDFGTILEDNSARVLREIDHLDATARSFSRFGTPANVSANIEPVDAAAIVRDVVALESLAHDGTEWRAIGADAPTLVRARGNELHEVLLNLCDNARNAGARRVELLVEPAPAEPEFAGRVVLRVVDNGAGVPAHLRARVFEPHFSTRTSGSGLGLAISRRLVEGWGGTISLDAARSTGGGTASADGTESGTVVTVALLPG